MLSTVVYCTDMRSLVQRYCTDLRHEELGDPLGEAAALVRQDHLEHVPAQLLHHHEDALRRLEHALQVHDSGVGQVLKDCYFVL